MRRRTTAWLDVKQRGEWGGKYLRRRGKDGVGFAAPSSQRDGRWLAAQVGKWMSKWPGDDYR
jgi:hypothetical protein